MKSDQSEAALHNCSHKGAYQLTVISYLVGRDVVTCYVTEQSNKCAVAERGLLYRG
jgi:hypothetical protein